MKSKAALTLGAVGFLCLNLMSGAGYQFLKFNVLGHSSGSGVVPGPGLIVPFLSLAVIPAGLVFGVMLHLVRTGSGHKSDAIVWIMAGYIACSLLFHGLVASTIILDNPFWNAG